MSDQSAESGSESAGDASNGNGNSDGSTSAGDAPGVAEKALMVVGFLLTLASLLYVGWHVVAVPASPAPDATVVGTKTQPDGDVVVEVKLRVPENEGLETATVSSQCASPPPTVEFSMLPSDSTWTGTLVCPPGTTDPSVSVSSWSEA